MSNFVSIKCYLLYDLWAYILWIVLNYKNLQFKQFIDDKKFCKYGEYKKKISFNGKFVKIHLQLKDIE